MNEHQSYPYGSYHIASCATPVHLEKEDTLQVYVRNYEPNMTVRCSGWIQPHNEPPRIYDARIALATGGSGTLLNIVPGEGTLLSCFVTPVGGGLQRGQTWVQVWLYRHNASTGSPTYQLIQGYLHADTGLCWPFSPIEDQVEGHGRIVLKTGSNPVAGAEIAEQVPALVRWRLVSFRFTLVASVDVAVRQVHLLLTNGATTYLNVPANATQTAGQTRNYNCAAFGVLPAATDSEIYIPLPPDLLLPIDFIIGTVTTNIQAADDFAAPVFTVEEWFET